MNNSTKIKTLIVIIVSLLIIDIVMLMFFIKDNGSHEKKQRNHESYGMYNSLKNEVGFSEDQLAEYKRLRENQMGKVKPMFNDVRKSKKDFYALIYLSNVTDSIMNADADSIAQKQRSLDIQMFGYFKNIRSICLPHQLQKFDSTLKKEVSRMVDKPSRNNSDHKK
ncbi:MAG: hypothetical protein ABI372_03325 [Ginsengibacter sp.]